MNPDTPKSRTPIIIDPPARCPNLSKSTRRRSQARNEYFLFASEVYDMKSRPLPRLAPSEQIAPENESPTHTTVPPGTKDPLARHRPHSDTVFRGWNDNVLLRWDEAHPLLRAVFYQREIATLGGISFSLNLGPRVEQMARKDPHGFTHHVSRRVSRELKKAFGGQVPHWFGIDVTPQGRPHLHGAIALPSEFAPLLSKALARAGGEWGSKRGRRHQVHIDGRLDDAWAIYSTRTITRRRRLELTPAGRKRTDPMLTASREVQRGARAAFMAQRKKMMAA